MALYLVFDEVINDTYHIMHMAVDRLEDALPLAFTINHHYDTVSMLIYAENAHEAVEAFRLGGGKH